MRPAREERENVNERLGVTDIYAASMRPAREGRENLVLVGDPAQLPPVLQ